MLEAEAVDGFAPYVGAREVFISCPSARTGQKLIENWKVVFHCIKTLWKRRNVSAADHIPKGAVYFLAGEFFDAFTDNCREKNSQTKVVDKDASEATL